MAFPAETRGIRSPGRLTIASWHDFRQFFFGWLLNWHSYLFVSEDKSICSRNICVHGNLLGCGWHLSRVRAVTWNTLFTSLFTVCGLQCWVADRSAVCAGPPLCGDVLCVCVFVSLCVFVYLCVGVTGQSGTNITKHKSKKWKKISRTRDTVSNSRSHSEGLVKGNRWAIVSLGMWYWPYPPRVSSRTYPSDSQWASHALSRLRISALVCLVNDVKAKLGLRWHFPIPSCLNSNHLISLRSAFQAPLV